VRHNLRVRETAGRVATMFILVPLLLLLAPFAAQAQSGQNFVIQPYGTVNVDQLPPEGSERLEYREAPWLPRDPAALQRAKAAAETGAAEGGAAPDVVPGPLNVNELTNFIGLKFSESGGFIPPDNGTAAGFNHIVEFVNVVGAIYNKSGVKQGANINLHTFFGTNQGLTDPVVRFDLGSQRWFVTMITVSVPLRWILAVSASDNPTGSWTLYSFNPDPANNNNLPDYPNMGISDDKVVLTANAFNAAGTAFLGAEFVVFNKSDLVAGTTAHTTFFAPDSGTFTLRAAMNLSSDTNIYMTSHNGSNSPTSIRVYTVTGLPTSISSASSSFVNRTVSAISQPPDAAQSGGAPLIQTDDNRLLDAAFRSTHLYTTATSGCLPSGDTSTRACVRVIEIVNPGTTATVHQDFNFGISGIYMYYPALSITSAGDVIAVFSRSSSSEFAGVWASGRLSTDPLNTFQPPTVIKAGEAHYNPFASRWGDYSSATIDPSDQTKVWVSGEYACPGACANGSNWGTWIAQTSIGTVTTNTITGSILVNGVGQASRTVKLTQGIHAVATTTTNGSGQYTFTPVNSGTYNIMILGVPGSGTFSGNVSLNGVGEPGKAVKVSRLLGTTLTDAGGNFSQAAVSAGNHTVTIQNVDVP
jgi:hypothetical protein